MSAYSYERCRQRLTAPGGGTPYTPPALVPRSRSAEPPARQAAGSSVRIRCSVKSRSGYADDHETRQAIEAGSDGPWRSLCRNDHAGRPFDRPQGQAQGLRAVVGGVRERRRRARDRAQRLSARRRFEALGSRARLAGAAQRASLIKAMRRGRPESSMSEASSKKSAPSASESSSRSVSALPLKSSSALPTMIDSPTPARNVSSSVSPAPTLASRSMPT